MNTTKEEIAELGKIELSLFVTACNWTYSDPEATAKRQHESHNAFMLSEIEKIFSLGKEDTEQAKKLATEYATGYKKRYESCLHSDSRCASSFITGGSNFPVAQMQKRNDIARRKGDELLSWSEYKMSKISNIFNPTIIKSADDTAIEQLQAKLDKLTSNQELMKKVNKLIKKYLKSNKLNKKELYDLLLTEGISEELAKSAVSDGFSTLGFPSYALTNNNAKIKNTSLRLIKLSKDKEEAKKIENGESEAREFNFKDGSVIYNYEAQRVQVLFNDKPCEAMRKVLKGAGCRWSPKSSAWQLHLKEWNYRKICDVLNAYYAEEVA